MIKIFVAEDQPLILQDITDKILSSRQDLSLCGTALNGEKALADILRAAPDIVFTDIKMPRLSGLEMMEKVKKELPQTKFVIISGYQDYEYMHKALQLEADEYLLKPVSPSDISRVLDHVCAKLLLSKHAYERMRIGEILSASARDMPDINLSFSYEHYLILVLNAGPCSTYGIDYLNPFAALWDKIDLEEQSVKYLLENERTDCYDGKTVNEKVLFCGINRSPKLFFEPFCRSVINKASGCGIPLTIGVSRPINSIANIGVESQIVRTLLRKNLVFAESKILLCDDTSLFRVDVRDKLTLQEQSQLAHSIEHNKKSAFRTDVSMLLDRARENHFSQQELQRRMNDMLSLCVAKAKLTTSEDLQLALEEALCNAPDYPALLNAVLPIYEQCLKDKAMLQGDVSHERLQQAMCYIATHFQQPLTINEIAEQYHIAPTYFSKMFKKEFGITAIESLTACRIDHAKSLLAQKRYTIREIAELCGYTDPFYFSRIFKGVTGVSPSEYTPD